MTTRTVEVSVASLAGVPLELMLLAAVYTVGPLLIALAVFYAAHRIASALRHVDGSGHVEPTAPKRSAQDAAYEAVRDWYAEDGGPTARACYTLLSAHTGRNN